MEVVSYLGSLFRENIKDQLLRISEKNYHSNLVVSLHVNKNLTGSINAWLLNHISVNVKTC